MSSKDYADDFGDFGGKVYLNTAYHGALPNASVAAAHEALRLKHDPTRIRDEHHFDYPDAMRAAAARLIGARPEDVAIGDSATHGIMLAAGGLSWRDGDEILIPSGEFPANRFPWYSLADQGVSVREIDLPRDETVAERMVDEIGPRTRLVSIGWVSYKDGLRVDIEALGRACRDRGVLFVVDGSQGVGGLPLDVERVGCDLLACAGYKWLLCPYGTGFSWIAPSLAARLRPGNVNWFAVEGARDFNRLGSCSLDYQPGARRFDVNETANFTNTATATASLEYLNRVTPAAVEAHVRELLDELLGDLPRGFRPASSVDERCRSNIVCIAGPTDGETDAAFRALTEQGIVVSRREGAIRISPHMFNTTEQIRQVRLVL